MSSSDRSMPDVSTESFPTGLPEALAAAVAGDQVHEPQLPAQHRILVRLVAADRGDPVVRRASLCPTGPRLQKLARLFDSK